MSLCVGALRDLTANLAYFIQQITTIMRLQEAPRFGSVVGATITHTCTDSYAYLHSFTSSSGRSI
jgi:hypothetical protein